ncbi:MAG TPA: hypothetical protein VL614_23230 [Acetobacteraceae bacterium]|nr:hypothetical protein [Acetobacteraceae bacterium]
MTLRAELQAHLQSELDDPAIARTLVDIVWQDALSWRAPVIPVDQVTAIVAFTFGNRMLPNGNREPGPVNDALADVVAALHQKTSARIFAQWEVASALRHDVPQDRLTTINPARDGRGEPAYLSTSGVLEEIARLVPPQSLGRVATVAFADHLHRCVATARRLGFDAYAPAGVMMPATYDPLSGQAWCRGRLAYLLHDMMIRVTERRADVVGSGWG